MISHQLRPDSVDTRHLLPQNSKHHPIVIFCTILPARTGISFIFSSAANKITSAKSRQSSFNILTRRSCNTNLCTEHQLARGEPLSATAVGCCAKFSHLLSSYLFQFVLSQSTATSASLRNPLHIE